MPTAASEPAAIRWNWHFLTRKLRDAAREFCAFERAEATATRREAERVLNLLKSNAGWRVRVWESLDWRWRLYYRSGRLSLWPRRATTASTVCSRCPPGGRPALQRPHPLLGSAERGHPVSAEHGAAKYWSDFQRKVSGALGEATPVEEPSRRQIQTPDLDAADAMQLTTYAYAFSQLAQYCNLRTGSILAGNQKSTASCGSELYRRLPACAERWRQP